MNLVNYGSSESASVGYGAGLHTVGCYANNCWFCPKFLEVLKIECNKNLKQN